MSTNHHTTIYVINISQAPANSSPLNPLGTAIRQYLWNELHRALTLPDIQSIIVTGGELHFSAGADLTEIDSFFSSSNKDNTDTAAVPTLINVVQAMEHSTKPIVAAIAGTCLGGGLEVALAAHYRVCTKTARLGLPEVHVGVIPGAGGTQRLPKLVGLQQALNMILTGTPVQASQALNIGLVDAVVEDNLLVETAYKWASWAQVMPLEERRTGQQTIREAPAQAHAMLQIASLQIPSKGGDGMRAALAAIRAACTLPLEQGMQIEKEQFLQTLVSEQGRARRHAFFATRRAQKMIQPPPEHPLLSKSSKGAIQVAVVGAGTMGSGIALVLLQAGFGVTLVDNAPAGLNKGLDFIRNTIVSRVERQKLSPKLATQMQSRLKGTQKLEDLSDCQLVVEAVVEKMSVKQQIFKALDQITSATTILLTNTSTLDVDAMANVVDPRRRKLFAGWHFFSPAHVMKLVEIVVGKETSADTTALLQALTKRIQKIGVVVGNCDGFCGNRLLKPYQAETTMLLVEGASTIEKIDKALTNFGMALGPFQLADLAGNDVGYYIRLERGWARKTPQDPVPRTRPARYTEVADVMVSDLGRTGQKVGKGWYDYNPAIGKGRKGLPSKEMHDLIQRFTTRRSGKEFTEEQIIERVLYPLVNEAFKCLEENIVRRPSDIDVIYLYGYGWPQWRGGPMYWADHEVTLPVLLDRLEVMAREFPETPHFVPSNLLKRCVRLGLTSEEYYAKELHISEYSKL